MAVSSVQTETELLEVQGPGSWVLLVHWVEVVLGRPGYTHFQIGKLRLRVFKGHSKVTQLISDSLSHMSLLGASKGYIPSKNSIPQIKNLVMEGFPWWF